ncbi:MAG: SDR family oxidoreductase [Arenicella sp.]
MKKVLLITGASSGIGASIAKLAANEEYAICVNYRHSKEKADAIVDELNKAGATAIALQADISKEDQAIQLFNELDEQLGPISALVNNAGVITPIDAFENIDEQRLKTVFEINVYGSFYCAREAVKRMSHKHGGSGGSIVNISSIAASLGSPNEFIDYAATKGAIDTMTKGLAKEVAAFGVRVNAIRPGLIETEMHAHAGDSDRPNKFKHVIPMQRTGSADEIAESVMWLLSDAASYVTGSLIDVSGGR